MFIKNNLRLGVGMIIFAKTTIDNRMLNHCKYELENDFTIGEFEEYIKEICYMLDIPNPVVLTKHIKNFILFNSTYFTEEDFVESINFERLVIEHGKGV